jgi:hypothetical protein
LVGKPEGKRSLGRHRSEGMVLKWILDKQNEVLGTEFSWLKTETNGGLL